MSDPIRILVVDDHEVVRRGMSSILSGQDNLLVVGAVGSGEEALELVPTLAPDVVLLDLQLGGMHGLEVIRRLLDRSQAPPAVVVLTVHDEDELVLDAVKAGASGYVLKDAPADELIRAIERVAAGGRHFDEVVVKAFLHEQERAGDLELLTARELEILRMVAAGATNREVGEHMFLSIETVKSHLETIYRKLDVSDRAHAVAVAMRKGILE